MAVDTGADLNAAANATTTTTDAGGNETNGM
jgi:hypothetical protein